MGSLALSLEFAQPIAYAVPIGMGGWMRRLLSAVALLLAMAPRLSPGAPPHSRVELLADVDAVSPGQPFTLAVRLHLDPGWHSYWVNPADAGAPLRAEWRLPRGYRVGDLQWPTPRLFLDPPLASYGYEGEVVLLATVTPPPDPALETLPISAKLSGLVCRDVCLPAQASVRLHLPIDKARPSPAADVIRQARDRMPMPADGWTYHLFFDDDQIALHGRAPAGALDGITGALFFPEYKPLIEHAAEQTWEQRGDVFRLTMKRDASAVRMPQRVKGVLRLESDSGRPPHALALNANVRKGKPHVFRDNP